MTKPHQRVSKAVPVFLITVSILFLFIMLIMPLIVVITEAFRSGIAVYKKAVFDVIRPVCCLDRYKISF